MRIIGAGLAGLIAGVLNPDAEIFEPMEVGISHQALLRFRTPDIGEAVGIPFKKVTAYKGIWFKNSDVNLSPKMISLYSQKVSGKISHRSICQLEPETRYVAPIDFQDTLRNICEERINYDYLLSDVLRYDGPILSTIPMGVLSELLDLEYILGEELEIIKSVLPVYVTRYDIKDCEAYMTYYYPERNMNLYRASISGNTLIIECMEPMADSDLQIVMLSFGLFGAHLNLQLYNFEQNNGKIKPIDENKRKKFILQATLEHGVYSLGRFAIWKDILLDDVYKDIGRIKHFINLSKYDQLKGS